MLVMMAMKIMQFSLTFIGRINIRLAWMKPMFGLIFSRQGCISRCKLLWSSSPLHVTNEGGTFSSLESPVSVFLRQCLAPSVHNKYKNLSTLLLPIYRAQSINQSSIFQDNYIQYIQVIVESQWLTVAVIQGQTKASLFSCLHVC